MTALALRSSRLAEAGFAHGFFTRQVEPDWEVACAELGIPRSRLFLPSQVHGRQVLSVGEGDDVAEVRRREADATLTLAPGVACGTRVADCVPVLLADRRTGAVAAVHSGWRGTVLGVVAAAVDALAASGADGALVAAIGPHIEVCCFEVGDDVAAEIAGASSVGAAAIDRSRPRPHVDLRRVVAAQLAALGVTDVDQVAGCTRCDAARFHSFRRDRQASGRLLAAIVAGPAGGPSVFVGDPDTPLG